jgi:hypothetical protein
MKLHRTNHRRPIGFASRIDDSPPQEVQESETKKAEKKPDPAPTHGGAGIKKVSAPKPMGFSAFVDSFEE